MIFRVFQFFVFFHLVFVQYAVSDDRLKIKPSETHDFNCKAIVVNDIAKFYFMDEINYYKNELRWNSNDNSAIEYSWSIYFEKEYIREGNRYNGIDIGVRYFLLGKEEKYKGPIDKLINASKIISFGYLENGSFVPIYLPSSKLEVNIANTDIVFSMKKSKETSFIFDNFPEVANFWVLHAGDKPRKCLSRIERTKVEGKVKGRSEPPSGKRRGEAKGKE